MTNHPGKPLHLDEYKKLVTVYCVPEAGHKPGPMAGSIGPDSTFWLYTSGLQALRRYELELRNVPSLFVGAGVQELNELGLYSVGCLIGPDQTIMTGKPVGVVLKARPSPDPFFVPDTCLRLENHSVLFVCQCCNQPAGQEMH